jgi:hypothetical protein
MQAGAGTKRPGFLPNQANFVSVDLEIHGVACKATGPYIPRRKTWVFTMRTETERTIAEIKQALALLRRHL